MTVPFKIRCGSCKVVLTIKNQKLVGKRIGCPKCKSPLIIKAPAPPGKKPKKPSSSQSIILEDQDDEYSDDGFANALSGTINTTGSSKSSSGSKSQVLKRRTSSSDSIKSYDDDYDDDFEDDDDEFLSDDEVPVAKNRKKSSKKSDSQKKFVIPAIIAAVVLVLGGIAYSFMGGSPATVTSANNIGNDQNDDQQEAKAPSAPKSKAGNTTNDEEEDTVAGDSDEENSGKKSGNKSKSKFSRKPLKKLKSSVVSKSSTKINLAYLYEDSEALVRIDMQKIMNSEFVQNLLSSSEAPPIPENLKDMESITIGIKGLSELSKIAPTGGLSPATMMKSQQALSSLNIITVVRFSSEIDQDKLLMEAEQKNAIASANPNINIEISELEFENHTIHVNSIEHSGPKGGKIKTESATCFIDDQTMISGQLKDVQYAIENSGVNIPRTSEFNNSKYKSQQFVAIFAPADPEKFFTSLGDSATEEESAEGGMPSFISLEMFKDLISVSIGASFSDSIDVKSHIKAGSPETTKNYEQMLNMLVQVGTSQLQAQANTAPEQFKEIYSLGEDLLRRIDFTLDEEELDINLPLVESDIETFKKLPGLVMMMMMQQSFATGGGPSKTPGGFSPGGKSSLTKNNLKTIGLAFHNYHDVYNGFPTAYILDSEEKPGLSWRVSLLPFLEENDLYEQFDLDKPWDDPHNLALADQMPDVFRSASQNLEPNQTKFRIVSDESTALSPEANNTIQSFKDGTANTVMVLEVDDDNATIWTKPDSIEYSDKVLSKLHDDNPTFLSLFADGTAKRIMPFELEELKMFLTRNGGEKIPENLLTSNNENPPPVKKSSPKKAKPKEKKAPAPKRGFSFGRKEERRPSVVVKTPPKVKKAPAPKRGFSFGRNEESRPSGVTKTPKKVNTTKPKAPKKNKGSSSFLDSTEDKAASTEKKPFKLRLGGGSFGGKDRNRSTNIKPKKNKRKSNFLKGGDDDDSEETDVDVQELIDEGASIKKDEDGNVIWLKMTGPKVKDETLEKISQISTLEHLILTKTSMTDEGLSHLSELAGLEKLILTQNKITDDGIDALIEISSLTNLAIKKTKITKKGAKKLSEELSDCKVLH